MNFFRKYATCTKWNLGFIEESMESIVGNAPITIHWMNHHEKKSWFADPFILDVDEKNIYVLVEEFYYPINRGRVSKLTINRKNYTLEKIEPTLELPTHLSFPAILRKNGKLYIYPENSASGKLTLYEYDNKNNACTQVSVLCDCPLTDAVCVDLFGKSFIASTRLPNPNKNILDYFEDGRFVSETKFETNKARNAGDWFVCKDSIYRPAQDCSKTYGGAVLLQKIEKDYNGNFCFSDIRRIESDNDEYNQGLHTFNHYKGLTVVDAKGFRYPFLNKVFFTVRRLLGRR